MEKHNIIRSLKYGLIAGIVSTMVTDTVSLVLFLVMGESLPSFFALIGQSFLTLINVEVAYPLWQGLVLHYSIGILTGLVLGLATRTIGKLYFNSYRKSILFSIIITEIEGTTLFYLMSLILNIPQSEMIIMYGLGFFLHVIWGTCLGLILSFGQRKNVPIPDNSAAFGKEMEKESLTF
jgi:hypothetical protein